MREVKFRCWVNNKMWRVYSIDFSDTDTLGTRVNVSKGGRLGFPIEHTNLMQYTGLKDKNDEEIYEGDVIQHHAVYEKGREEDIKQVIEFELREAGDDADCDSYGYHINPYWGGDYEVIGNIYENPELIKVGK